ncbi:MAG: hypothetical protein K8R59_18380 [Thermoanaerobaculales bacterium]|nr:hypothetical protein [Thermoanaerobaculales bacterium]
MPEQPVERRPRILSKPTLGLIALGCIALAAALVAGIADNPPGAALLFGSVICFLLAIVHRWSRPRTFLWFAAAAAVSFPVFVILHNVFYGLGEMASERPLLHGLCEVLHVITFFVAVLISPPALVIGLLGALVTYLVRKREMNRETGGSS